MNGIKISYKNKKKDKKIMAKEEKQRLTWDELKAFCNALPESELQNPVVEWGEETAGYFTAAERLSEDYVIDDSMDSCIEESEYEAYKEDYEADETTKRIVWKKGMAILFTDFY
jgi:hypothetical protein